MERFPYVTLRSFLLIDSEGDFAIRQEVDSCREIVFLIELDKFTIWTDLRRARGPDHNHEVPYFLCYFVGHRNECSAVFLHKFERFLFVSGPRIHVRWACYFRDTGFTIYSIWCTPFEDAFCICPLSQSELRTDISSEHHGIAVCDRVDDFSICLPHLFALTVPEAKALDLVNRTIRIRYWAIASSNVDSNSCWCWSYRISSQQIESSRAVVTIISRLEPDLLVESFKVSKVGVFHDKAAIVGSQNLTCVCLKCITPSFCVLHHSECDRRIGFQEDLVCEVEHRIIDCEN
jgi:hypothetical protein